MQKWLLFCSHENLIQWYKEEVSRLNPRIQLEFLPEEELVNFDFSKASQWALIKFNPYMSDVVYERFHTLNEIEKITGHFDSVINGKKAVSLLYKALIREIRQVNRNLDTSGEGLICCETSLLKCLILTAAQLGLKTIKLVTLDEEQSKKHVEALQKHIFSLNIELVEPKNLTLLASRCSVALCGLLGNHQTQLLTDLSYLNFMKKNGIAVDVALSLENSLIIEEAINIQLPYLDGLLIEAAALDIALSEIGET